MVTKDNMGWYDTLAKSSLNPPDIVFPIVWSILYVLLALAAHKVWHYTKEHGVTLVFVAFWVQMVMNWAWSFIFFGAHEITLGFYWIVALVAAMGVFIALSWNSCRRAGVYALPTLFWGIFAAYLNYSIIVLN